MLKFEMMTARIQRSAKYRGGGGSLHTCLKRKYPENIVVMRENLSFIISCELIMLLSVSRIVKNFLVLLIQELLVVKIIWEILSS